MKNSTKIILALGLILSGIPIETECGATNSIIVDKVKDIKRRLNNFIIMAIPYALVASSCYTIYEGVKPDSINEPAQHPIQRAAKIFTGCGALLGAATWSFFYPIRYGMVIG